MNEIIKRLNDTYEATDKKSRELDKLLVTAQEQLKILDKVRGDLNAREVGLNEREGKIGKIESVLALKTEGTRLLNEAKEINDKTLAERKTFLEWLDKEKASLAHCQRGVDSSIQAIKEREEALEREKKQLSLDKVTYRENIIREIGKMTNANT